MKPCYIFETEKFRDEMIELKETIDTLPDEIQCSIYNVENAIRESEKLFKIILEFRNTPRYIKSDYKRIQTYIKKESKEIHRYIKKNITFDRKLKKYIKKDKK